MFYQPKLEVQGLFFFRIERKCSSWFCNKSSGILNVLVAFHIIFLLLVEVVFEYLFSFYKSCSSNQKKSQTLLWTQHVNSYETVFLYSICTTFLKNNISHTLMLECFQKKSTTMKNLYKFWYDWTKKTSPDLALN